MIKSLFSMWGGERERRIPHVDDLRVCYCTTPPQPTTTTTTHTHTPLPHSSATWTYKYDGWCWVRWKKKTCIYQHVLWGGREREREHQPRRLKGVNGKPYQCKERFPGWHRWKIPFNASFQSIIIDPQQPLWAIQVNTEQQHELLRLGQQNNP